MPVDPFAPYEAAANGGGPIPPAMNPHNARYFPPGAPNNLGYAPNAGVMPPNYAAPLSGVPSPPAPHSVAQSFGDYGEIPNIESLELRTYSDDDSRLRVFKPDSGLDYRWCNSDADIQMKRRLAGWRVVRRYDAAASDDAGAETPRLQAGTQRTGEGRKAILMCRPKEFSALQAENHRRMLRERNASLDPKHFSGNAGGDAGMFKGQINIRGSEKAG